MTFISSNVLSALSISYHGRHFTDCNCYRIYVDLMFIRYFKQEDKGRVRLCTAHIPVQANKPPSSFLTLWETDAYRPQTIVATSQEPLCCMNVR